VLSSQPHNILLNSSPPSQAIIPETDAKSTPVVPTNPKTHQYIKRQTLFHMLIINILGSCQIYSRIRRIEIEISNERNRLIERADVQTNPESTEGRQWTIVAQRQISRDAKATNRDQIGVVAAERERNIECK
jgi:hypothetical protein